MATLDQSAPRPIVPPPDFPVTWEQPADERLFWIRNSAIFPNPITPLTHSFLAVAYDPAITAAMNAYGDSVQFRFCRINSYRYNAIVTETESPVDAAEQARRSHEMVEAAMARLGDWWERELLPEIQAHLAFWEEFDLRGASLPALLAHLDATIARKRRLSDIELLLGPPHLTAPSMFIDLYAELFGTETGLEAYRLLQGFDNKTLETDRALWRLSRVARATPEVQTALVDHSPAEALSLLEQSAAGRAFLAELRTFLTVYGQRGHTLIEAADPSWIEDPTPALTTLRLYAAQADRDPGIELAALAAEREELIAAARSRLSGYPRPVVAQFEFLLSAAQVANVIAEDHNYWIDGRSMYQVRRVLLEFGQRFAAAGNVTGPDDIFYLTLDELRETAAELPRGDRRGVVATRRAEIDHFRAIEAPPALGTPPSGPPPMATPFARAMGRFFGEPPAQDGETDPCVVRGNAGSPGVARGRARIIRTLAEADTLCPGDVLVTRSTAPAWTPLFATAAAIVTDAGGVLSHCAVVAREYRLPAVVGTGTATTTLRDGQLLEVDGAAGVVRILSAP